MAAGTLTALDAILQDMYLPGFVKQFYAMVPAYERITKVRASDSPHRFDFQGRQATIAAKTGRNERGIGARAEGEALPTAGVFTASNMNVSMKYNYAVVSLTGPAIQATKGSKNAFVDALQEAMADAKEGLSFNIATQMVFGDGTGILAYTNGSGSSSTSLIVDTPGSEHIHAGMYIDVYTSGGTQEINNVKVSSISSNTLTLESAQTWSDNAYVYRKGERNNVAMGFGGIVDDSTRVATFQGLARSTNTWLKANVLSASGTNRPITLRLVDDMALKAKKTLSSSGENPTAIYSRCAIMQNYADIIKADRRFTGKETTISNGYRAVEVLVPGVGVLPWINDEMCRPNEVWAIKEDDLEIFEMMPVQWIQHSGRILREAQDGSDGIEATVGTYHNLGARRCNSHTALKDITEG